MAMIRNDRGSIFSVDENKGGRHFKLPLCVNVIYFHHLKQNKRREGEIECTDRTLITTWSTMAYERRKLRLSSAAAAVSEWRTEPVSHSSFIQPGDLGDGASRGRCCLEFPPSVVRWLRLSTNIEALAKGVEMWM
jgi:hypothetical protein